MKIFVIIYCFFIILLIISDLKREEQIGIEIKEIKKKIEKQSIVEIKVVIGTVDVLQVGKGVEEQGIIEVEEEIDLIKREAKKNPIGIEVEKSIVKEIDTEKGNKKLYLTTTCM